MKDRGKLNGQVDEPPYADSKQGVAGRETVGTPDGGRLVFAVTVAMLLGVACGLWLSARLASAAMEATALPAPSRPTLNADGAEAATTESAPLKREDVSPEVNGPTPPTAARESGDEKSGDEKDAVSTPPRAPAEKSAGVRGVSNETRAEADEAEAPRETAGRKNATARGAASPCPLYASAGALNVRSGGEATLVLGGPNQQGRVSVTTPDWSDIAVFPEGQAGGNRGWVKYSVRSVSKRAGVFSVRVKGPCGSLTIPVRVARP